MSATGQAPPLQDGSLEPLVLNCTAAVEQLSSTQVVESVGGSSTPMRGSASSAVLEAAAAKLPSGLSYSSQGGFSSQGAISPCPQMRSAVATSPGVPSSPTVSTAATPWVSVAAPAAEWASVAAPAVERVSLAAPAAPLSPMLMPRRVAPTMSTLQGSVQCSLQGSMQAPSGVSGAATSPMACRRATEVSMSNNRTQTVVLAPVTYSSGYTVQQSTSPMVSVAAPAAPPSPMFVELRAPISPMVSVAAPAAPPSPMFMERQVEYQGLSAMEVSGMMQQERPRIYSAIQDMIQQSMKADSERLNAEVSKVTAMVNAVSATCDERLIRLEVDRAARNTHLHGYRRDVDGLQAQINELSQSKGGGSDVLVIEHEESLVRIDSITKDMKNQYHTLAAGFDSQKSEQAKVDQILADLRREQRSMLERLEQQNEDREGLQGRVEKTVADLRARVNQSLQGFMGEVESLRALGSLPGRVVRLEEKTEEIYCAFLDQDITGLTRLVRAETQARIGLSESLDAYRQAYLQTTNELRSELDGILEKQTRAGATAEDRGRIATIERSLSEVRNMVSTQTANSRIDIRGSDTLLTRDIQELSGRVSAESAARLDLTSSLDAYRGAYVQTTTELRAELDVAREKLARLEATLRSELRRDRTKVTPEVDNKTLLLSGTLTDGLRSFKAP